jgi:hypothetical protein
MKAPVFRAVGTLAPRFIADFDSTSAMVHMLGRYLRWQEAPGMGGVAPSSQMLAALVNALPRAAREALYTVSGWAEAIPAHRLGDVRVEEFSRWVTNSYPRRAYPAAIVGSSSGALVHLAAALRIPWLPQTFLIPVRRTGVDPDEPKQDLEWGRAHAGPLLATNSDIQLHHMHDPNQDRLMIRLMTYFRVKRLRLGNIYERFLTETLAPGGTIFIAECQQMWRTTRVGDRHVFQFGALGGATIDEYFHGSDRVAAYLQRYGSARRKWDPPEPDEERPEAEWGFEPALRADIARFARQHGYRLRRIIFQDPEHLSPLVADLYRWWYAQRRLAPSRLFVESFVVMEPFWTLRLGAVPFWLTFNTEPSAEWLNRYLESCPPYDYIHLALFSHGVDSVGVVPIERWRAILGHARQLGTFVGVDTARYPRDYASALKQVPARYPIPGALTLRQLDGFLAKAAGRHAVQWLDSPAAQRPAPSLAQ